MSDSLWPPGLQQARLPRPSPSPSLLRLMSVESVMPSNHLILYHPLLLLPSIFPSIRVFTMSQPFVSGGQSIGTSASVLSMNIQHWFPLTLTGLISLQSKGLSRVFSNTTVQKHQFFSTQPWIFIGRNDAEARVHWPPDAKSWLIGKYPDDDLTSSSMQWTGVCANSGDSKRRNPGVMQSMGLQRIGHDLTTEQQQRWSLL